MICFSGKQLRNVIALGDFNTYSDFDWPMTLATNIPDKQRNLCHRYISNSDMLTFPAPLKDAWLTVSTHDKGLTFSNMVNPYKHSALLLLHVLNIGMHRA